MTLKEQVELAIYRRGGWLTVANAMHTTPEALRKRVRSARSKGNLQAILLSLQQSEPTND